MWTNTCCSHPIMNNKENINPENGTKRGAIRRLKEELNLTEDINNQKFVDKIYYKANCNEFFSEHEVDWIFLYKRRYTSLEAQVNYDDREVNDIAWVTKENLNRFIESKIDKGEKQTPWFSLIIQNRLLEKYWDMVINNQLLDQNNINIKNMVD